MLPSSTAWEYAGNASAGDPNASKTNRLQFAGVCGPVQGTIDAGSMSGGVEVTSPGPFTWSVAMGKSSESTWSGGKPPCFAK